MELDLIDEAIELLEKANAELEPERPTATVARDLLAAYARIEKLASYGVARATGLDGQGQVDDRARKPPRGLRGRRRAP